MSDTAKPEETKVDLPVASMGPKAPGMENQKVAVTMEEKMAEALFIAVGNNQAKVVEKLLEKGAKTDWMHGKHTPLRLAAQRGFFPIVRLLHEQGGVSIKDDIRILHVTVLGDTCNKTVVDYLVSKGADVNSEDPTLGTPLMSALSKGKDCDAAKWLVELGAKKSKKSSSTPLHKAVKAGDCEKAKLLLADGGEELLVAKDAHGMVPLMCAAENGNDDLVSLFIGKYAATIDDGAAAGFTPLFLAVQNDHITTAAILLEAKADVNAVSTSNRGASPIHLAASNGYISLMELLFKHGADPDVACQGTGLTPMHMAVSEGLTTAVKILLDAKASVHKKDGEGRSPLLHAVMGNHPWTAVLLVQRGADPSMGDNDGVTPVDIVKEHSLGHMANAFTRSAEIDVDDLKSACGACMGAMEQTKRCSRCKITYYCSAECQKRHWGHHKLTCKPCTPAAPAKTV